MSLIVTVSADRVHAHPGPPAQIDVASRPVPTLAQRAQASAREEAETRRLAEARARRRAEANCLAAPPAPAPAPVVEIEVTADDVVTEIETPAVVATPAAVVRPAGKYAGVPVTPRPRAAAAVVVARAEPRRPEPLTGDQIRERLGIRQR